MSWPTAKTLLPPNATDIEYHLEQGLLFRDATHDAISQLRGIKLNPPDELLPWLIWEYGLAVIVPYLPDLRLVLREGLLWQKERGTESAVRRALSWIDIRPERFEHEMPGVHWNEFQIDTGRVPTREELQGIIALSAMSAPARSKLRRLYHGCDRRRFVLSESDWGDLLSDYSGVRLSEYGGYLAIAFCHKESSEVDHNMLLLTDHSLWLMASEQAYAWTALRLSFDKIFGEVPVPNHAGLVMFFFSDDAVYQPPAYWSDATWPDLTWAEVRTTPGMSTSWFAGVAVAANLASSTDFQAFLSHSQVIRFDIQTDNSVTWLTGSESESYSPVWHNTGWVNTGWQHDILIESDYS